MGYVTVNWDKVEQDVMGVADVNGGSLKDRSLLFRLIEGSFHLPLHAPLSSRLISYACT